MSSVDVVVPCYRYGHFLRECVESVLQQRGVDVRVLIIDDASPDDTADVAAALVQQSSKVTFVRHAANQGHIATYNEGIDWVSADYYMILSADDYLLPGALARAAMLMDGHAEAGFCYGRAITLDPLQRSVPSQADQQKSGWQVLPGSDFIRMSGARNIVPTPTAIVRTVLQKRVGGYLPELPHSGDMELWFRLAAHASVGILACCQAVYRRHSNNMSLQYWEEGLLPDLFQRKTALDCFFSTSVSNLPNHEQLQRELLSSLAIDAVGLSSEAFNAGQIEISRRIADFAVKICSGIKLSSAWTKLRCKQLLGYQLWQVIQATFAVLRGSDQANTVCAHGVETQSRPRTQAS